MLRDQFEDNLGLWKMNTFVFAADYGGLGYILKGDKNNKEKEQSNC